MQTRIRSDATLTVALSFLSSWMVPEVKEGNPLLPGIAEVRENPVIEYVVVENLGRFCPFGSLGCATVPYDPEEPCKIYMRSNTPRWVVDHEELHCKGYDHTSLPEAGAV